MSLGSVDFSSADSVNWSVDSVLCSGMGVCMDNDCNIKCIAHVWHSCTATSPRTLGEFLGPTQEIGHGQRVKMLAERASQKNLSLVTRYQIV